VVCRGAGEVPLDANRFRVRDRSEDSVIPPCAARNSKDWGWPLLRRPIAVFSFLF